MDQGKQVITDSRLSTDVGSEGDNSKRGHCDEVGLRRREGVMRGDGRKGTAGLDVLCRHTQKISLPRDQEGYDRFEYTDEKLSTRRIPQALFLFFGIFEKRDRQMT